MIPLNYEGVVLFQLAGNDCSELDSETIINSYENLLDHVRLRAPKCNIIVSAIPPRRGTQYLAYKIGRVNDFLHCYALQDNSVTYLECPLYSATRHFRQDGVHFNEFGRTLYCSNIQRTFTQIFQHSVRSIVGT